MKTFYRYAALVAGSLLGLCACSSDDDVADASGKTPVAQPQVIVSELTTTGFKIRWEAVEGAGAYVYTFNGSEETSTDACQLSFGDLERQKEYVVAVKATPKFADENTESPYTYVHVVTDDLEQLPQPKITLGCAYASKTLITWTEVPETALYEYTIGGETYTTTDRMVTLGNLSKDRDYTFSLRAMTGDATRFTNSEPAELPFRTSADDIPAILIAPTLVISGCRRVQRLCVERRDLFLRRHPGYALRQEHPRGDHRSLSGVCTRIRAAAGHQHPAGHGLAAQVGYPDHPGQGTHART